MVEVLITQRPREQLELFRDAAEFVLVVSRDGRWFHRLASLSGPYGIAVKVTELLAPEFPECLLMVPEIHEPNEVDISMDSNGNPCTTQRGYR